ncbi:hypothetical protein [Fusobacterium animalis]|uniref:hypothetical protein n=1 Tax=Fusobacterium animalis TaxID=76859 RepID=UPI0030D07017
MTEVTKDKDTKTDIFIESQTINYIKNPEAFKQDLKKAKNEIEDIGNVIENTLNPPGEDKRNFFKNLRAQRFNTSFYNVTGSRMEELSRQFKAGEIDENQLKEAARDIVKGYGKDIGIDFEVVYLDESTMPKDAKGSTGSAYILDEKNRKVLIPIDVNKIKDTEDLFGTLTEEVSHGKDALEGRQDKKVTEDETNGEKGLESLGRPANDYVKNKLGDDNNSNISLATDGIDLTNADVGDKVGDHPGYLMFVKQEEKVRKTLEENKGDISSSKFHKELIRLAGVGGQGIIESKYEGVYVLQDKETRKQILNKDGTLHLDEFDSENWKKVENSEIFKEKVEELRKDAQEYYKKNKDNIINEAEEKQSKIVDFTRSRDAFTTTDLEFALGKTTIWGRVIIDRGKPYLRYNITDRFEDPASIKLEWGEPYQMLGPSRIIPLFDEMGLEQ